MQNELRREKIVRVRKINGKWFVFSRMWHYLQNGNKYHSIKVTNINFHLIHFWSWEEEVKPKLCHCGIGTKEECKTQPWGCNPAAFCNDPECIEHHSPN